MIFYDKLLQIGKKKGALQKKYSAAHLSEDGPCGDPCTKSGRGGAKLFVGKWENP